jgi:hypothetical protein
MKKIFLTMALALGLMATAQVKIGTDVDNINPASLLELESSTQGVNFPKLALTSTIVAAPLAGGVHVAGMTVYNSNTIGDVTPGLYTNNGAAWVKLGGSNATVFTARTGLVAASSYDWAPAIGGLVNFYEFTSGSEAITLPNPLTHTGKFINVRNNTGATINFGSVDGITRPRGVAALVASGALQLWSDGTYWHNIAGRN